MSQDIWTSINPTTTSGVMLVALLDDFKDAIMTGFSGTSRPANLQAGGSWIDTTNQAAPDYQWSFKVYNGTTDTEIFRISILNGIGGTLLAASPFEIQEIAADAVGPILELIKNRIVNNGQLLSGDSVAEIKFTGCTNTGSSPTVGYLSFTATDDMTTSVYGGTFSFYSTPDATAAIAEHLRFIAGQVETVVPHKINSSQPVSQNIATATIIVQLSAAKRIVEMTGSTATDIQGINSGHDSKVVTVHNRSTAVVTLKHLNTSAAAADRIKLPNNLDLTIPANSSATLFYCTTDTYWKLKSAVDRPLSRTMEKMNGAYQSWTAPIGISRIRVVSYPPAGHKLGLDRFIDQYGNMYAWGMNSFGELGVGDVTARSSPVLVLGGIQWDGLHYNGTIAYNQSTGCLSTSGIAYMWGLNQFWQLGTGDNTPRSSPVAVLGGLKFSALIAGGISTLALSEDGSPYAWGYSESGELGVGDTTPRSSPVAVLGGLKFSRVYAPNDFNGHYCSFGITRGGAAYAWGNNFSGQLGVGNVVPRSSPVAVLGGLTFKKILPVYSQSGDMSVIGLTTSGTLYGWGSNSKGQLGTGDITPRSSPVAVLGGLTFHDVFVSIGGLGASVFGVQSDGTTYAWGVNNNGQLGVGDVTARSSPVAVLGGLKFKKLASLESETTRYAIVGLTTSGLLYAWGNNQYGELGVGNVAPRSSPVAVLGGLTFSALDPIAYGSYGRSFHAVQYDGSIYSWGYGLKGSIGDGTNVDKSSPVAVIGGLGCLPETTVSEIEIAVTPGNSYDVILSMGQSMFGTTPLGINVDNITIEYEGVA